MLPLIPSLDYKAALSTALPLLHGFSLSFCKCRVPEKWVLRGQHSVQTHSISQTPVFSDINRKNGRGLGWVGVEIMTDTEAKAID